MIPIFRAKKIDSDEYVQGYYYKDERLISGYSHKIHTFSKFGTVTTEIDEDTLAIHFPDMLDSQGNKLFASLKGKKGASRVLIKFNEDFSNDCVEVGEGSFIECFIKFENGGLFFEEQDSTWYYLDDILNLDCEITEIGIQE